MSAPTETPLIPEVAPKTPIRVAFCGAMRTGKDTGSDYLTANLRGVKLKFADPLYAMMHAVQDVAGMPHKKDGKLLQILGTEWGRETIDQNIWVNLFEREVKRLDAEADEAGRPRPNIFVSDARFTNEFEKLKSMGFTLVLLKRPKRLREAAEVGATVTKRNTNHASERDWKTFKGFDHTIQANSTVIMFLKRVNRMIKTAYGKKLPTPGKQDRKPNWRGEDGRLFLVRCFQCDPIHGLENSALHVSSGTCAFCGWDESKGDE